MKTLKLSATLAALVLTASTACAAVIDFGNALGSSGGYTSQAYYQAMLGGQPMTAAEQAYADQEDELRQMGFQAELGGDFALGQMFYHMAYGVTPPLSVPGSGGGGGGLGPSSGGPNNGGAGSSLGSDKRVRRWFFVCERRKRFRRLRERGDHGIHRLRRPGGVDLGDDVARLRRPCLCRLAPVPNARPALRLRRLANIPRRYF